MPGILLVLTACLPALLLSSCACVFVRPATRCWGFMVLGTVDPQVAKSYRASRGPIEHKVVFRD